jgi:hypothetical protein
MRMLGAIALAGALIVTLTLGGLDYFIAEEAASPDPVPPVQTEQTPSTAEAKKPSAMPVLPGDEGVEEPAEQAAAEQQQPQNRTDTSAPRAPAATQPPKPKPASTDGPAETRLVTSPPGAFVVVDGSSSLSCQTPCSVTLPPGRHTLAVTLEGYRRTLRIFESPNDSEIFINLDRANGTLVIRSNPAGATIVVDGQQRPEKTPAMLTLGAGQHTVELIRNGQRESRQINVRDAGIANLTVEFQ